MEIVTVWEVKLELQVQVQVQVPPLVLGIVPNQNPIFKKVQAL